MAQPSKPEVWNQSERYRNENAALLNKNKVLEEEVKRFRTVGVTPSDVEESEVLEKKRGCCARHSRLLKVVFVGVPCMLVVVAGLLCIGLYIGDKTHTNEGNGSPNWSALMPPMTLKSKRPKLGWYDDGVDDDLLTYNKKYINIGVRRDFLLQECQGPELKRSFPDLDYALMGYNVLKAFPLAVGHDPGFSLPIFTADYSHAGQTADCRYSVPRGVVVTPDVSCVVSFTSKIIQTRYEFSKSLSASAHLSGGGWGLSFSASAGYKQASSTISTGEYSYILSTANCRYYYSQIMAISPPPFHPAFVEWVHRLDAAADNVEDVYAEFFDTYGTHFAPYVTFGARYTHESKMESKKLEKMSESGVNVAAAASYSGLFSVGGGFSLDMSQKQSASDFQKNTETKTITVGAPPPSTGDAQKWASTVKEDPVPVEYKLASIEDLFSSNYMSNLGVNYTRIANNIQRLKGKYCQFLMDRGEIDSCQELQPGLELKTRLMAYYSTDYRMLAADKATCIEECMAEVTCVAITKCVRPKCTSSFHHRYCYLFQDQSNVSESANRVHSADVKGWQSIVFLPKIYHKFCVRNTALRGTERGRANEDEKRAANHKHCWNWCFDDEQCIAFSYCDDCPSKSSNCHLYAERSIFGMKYELGTDTYYISRLRPPPSHIESMIHNSPE